MKKLMKHFKHIFLLALYFTSALFMVSCEPDDPDDDPAARSKFVGNWTSVESSQLTYTVVISESASNDYEVLLANFHHLGVNEKAIGSIAGYTITIPEQFMCDGDYTVKGSGIMAANQKTISFQYVASGGATTDTIHATYTKQ